MSIIRVGSSIIIEVNIFAQAIYYTLIFLHINRVKNHWGNLKHHYSDNYVGCSAEGHISHIYSDRLSSRPLGWSKERVDQMARLRVYVANGGSIYDITLKKKQERAREAKIGELD